MLSKFTQGLKAINHNKRIVSCIALSMCFTTLALFAAIAATCDINSLSDFKQKLLGIPKLPMFFFVASFLMAAFFAVIAYTLIIKRNESYASKKRLLLLLCISTFTVLGISSILITFLDIDIPTTKEGIAAAIAIGCIAVAIAFLGGILILADQTNFKKAIDAEVAEKAAGTEVAEKAADTEVAEKAADTEVAKKAVNEEIAKKEVAKAIKKFLLLLYPWENSFCRNRWTDEKYRLMSSDELQLKTGLKELTLFSQNPPYVNDFVNIFKDIINSKDLEYKVSRAKSLTNIIKKLELKISDSYWYKNYSAAHYLLIHMRKIITLVKEQINATQETPQERPSIRELKSISTNMQVSLINFVKNEYLSKPHLCIALERGDDPKVVLKKTLDLLSSCCSQENEQKVLNILYETVECLSFLNELTESPRNDLIIDFLYNNTCYYTLAFKEFVSDYEKFFYNPLFKGMTKRTIVLPSNENTGLYPTLVAVLGSLRNIAIKIEKDAKALNDINIQNIRVVISEEEEEEANNEINNCEIDQIIPKLIKSAFEEGGVYSLVPDSIASLEELVMYATNSANWKMFGRLFSIGFYIFHENEQNRGKIIAFNKRIDRLIIAKNNGELGTNIKALSYKPTQALDFIDLAMGRLPSKNAMESKISEKTLRLRIRKVQKLLIDIINTRHLCVKDISLNSDSKNFPEELDNNLRLLRLKYNDKSLLQMQYNKESVKIATDLCSIIESLSEMASMDQSSDDLQVELYKKVLSIEEVALIYEEIYNCSFNNKEYHPDDIIIIDINMKIKYFTIAEDLLKVSRSCLDRSHTASYTSFEISDTRAINGLQNAENARNS